MSARLSISFAIRYLFLKCLSYDLEKDFLKKLFKRKNILILGEFRAPSVLKLSSIALGGKKRRRREGNKGQLFQATLFLGWAKIPPVLTNSSHAGYFLLLFFSVSNFWGSSKSPVVIWLPPNNRRRRMFALVYLKAFFREIARRFSPSLSVRWPPVNQGAKRGLGENQFRALFLLPATSHIILKRQSRTWHAADALLLFFSVYGKRNSPKCSKHLGECNENCGNSFAVQKGKIYFYENMANFGHFGLELHARSGRADWHLVGRKYCSTSCTIKYLTVYWDC